MPDGDERARPYGHATVSLWDSGLPKALRVRDTSGVLQALVRVADSQLQARYDDITEAFAIRDPLTCEARWLPVIARERGWRLDETLPEALRRKITAVLVALYQEKGTAQGLTDAVRLFLGEEARVRASWGGAWRMGRGHLGGYSARVTATEGQSTLDLAAATQSSPGAWTCVPHVSRVRAWLNGVELDAWRFLPTSRTTVLMLTEGVRYTARGGESYLDLGFAYYGLRGALVVAKNGRRIEQPDGWRELTGGAMYSRITFPTSLTRGDVITVWHRDPLSDTAVTPLSSGDVVRVSTDDVLTTRLAPLNASDGATGGFSLRVELPRTISADERRWLLAVLDVMKPGRMAVTLSAAEEAPARWVLGTGRLGRDARLGP